MESSEPTVKPSKFLVRLLDPTAHWDYLGLVLLALWPILYAYLIGAHNTVCVGPGVESGNSLTENCFLGYWQSPNWTWQVVFLPLILFLLRWSMGRIASVRGSQIKENIPPIIQLIKSPEGQAAAYTSLRNTLLSHRNVWIAIFITIVIHILDMNQLISIYFDGVLDLNTEQDWSIMFLMSETLLMPDTISPRPGENLLLVVSAYFLQVLLVIFLFLFAILVTQHNLFFLNRVYQRRLVSEEQTEEYIIIDLDDVNNCFGFRMANQAFNVQVLLLAMIGAGLLFSRFINVANNNELFPDAGQAIMTIGWFVGLFVVALPVWVKMLPLCPWDEETPDTSIVTYLREFIPEKQWPYGDEPDSKVIDTLAGRFAINAFWPTGNNRAATVFFLSFLAALYLIVPPIILIDSDVGELPDWARDFWIVIFGSLFLYGILAKGLTTLLLWIVTLMLNHVDERLVTEPEGPVMTIMELNESLGVEGEKEDIGVFISYRRSDSAGYTGRLKENLDRLFYKERVFYDLQAVGAGTDFVHEIEDALDSSDVILVVIGPGWLEFVGEISGEQQQGEIKDYVVFEIAEAMRREVPVIPVLMGGAQMPKPDEFPVEIVNLSRFQAVEITDSRWAYDFEKLVEGVQSLSKEGQ